MSAMAGGTRTRGFGTRERVVVLAAAALGFAAGVAVNFLWPNPVYGSQLIAGLVAIGLMLLGVALWRGRRFPASIAIGAGAGLLLGIAIGYDVRPGAPTPNDVATVHVDLLKPVVATMNTTSGRCVVLDDRLMLLEAGDPVALVDGRSVAITLSRGQYREFTEATGDGDLTVDVRIDWALDDGTSTVTWMGSDATSVVEASGTAAKGGVTFSGLVVRPDSEQRDPIEVEGVVSWDCEAP